MKANSSILTITDSDYTCQSGYQADIKNVTRLAGNVITVPTGINIHNNQLSSHDIPTKFIADQTRHLIQEYTPHVVKVGFIQNPETITAICDEIADIKNIVCAPEIMSPDNIQMIEDNSINAIFHYLVPVSTLLILNCNEAEKMLGGHIKSDDDMVNAAKQFVEKGAKWVFIYGGKYAVNKLSSILYGHGKSTFFSSYNIEGWQKKGVKGGLAIAAAARLSTGDKMQVAVNHAHNFVLDNIVNVVSEMHVNLHVTTLYNQFLSLVAENYQQEHNVYFYAGKMSITTRYLSQITSQISEKTPKDVISDYLMNEAKMLLTTSSLSIYDISMKLGFSSQTMFCKFFKNLEHQTPTRFRTNGL